LYTAPEITDLSERAVGAIRQKDVHLEVRVTWEGGDAERYAGEAVESGVDVVIAARGDGTVNGVVNGIMSVAESPEVAVGVVPVGTANDFATGCGIPLGDPLAALTLAADGDSLVLLLKRLQSPAFIHRQTPLFLPSSVICPCLALELALPRQVGQEHFGKLVRTAELKKGVSERKNRESQ
jgi:hypothetical protein